MSARSQSPSLGIHLAAPDDPRGQLTCSGPPDPRAQLARAAEAGYAWVRIPIAWRWFEPRAGELDEDRFASCLDLIERAHDRGLTGLVSLDPGPVPAWAGKGFWLDTQAPQRYGLWVEAAARRLAGVCRHWITMSRMNAHALGPWLPGGNLPGKTLATGDAVRALGHMLAAHTAAHRAIHRLRPDAQVTTDNRTSSVYEADRLGIDILLAPRNQVDRRDLGDWLRERRRSFYRGLPNPSLAESWLRSLVAEAVPLDQAFPRAVAASYDCDGVAPLDSIHLAFANPRLAEVATLRTRAALLPRPIPGRPRCHPPRLGELASYCNLNQEPGLQLWVTVPGHRHHQPVGHPPAPGSSCGWDGPRLVAAALAAAGDGVAAVIHPDHEVLPQPALLGSSRVPDAGQAAM